MCNSRHGHDDFAVTGERIATVCHQSVVEHQDVARLPGETDGGLAVDLAHGVEHVVGDGRAVAEIDMARSEEHTSELQSLMRISYAVFCLKKKKKNTLTQ